MFDLTGKTALVTGSSQGIGAGITKCLAEHGAHVFVHGSRNLQKVQAAAKSIGKNVSCVVGDLTQDGCAEKLYAQTGDIDILVLNASMQFRHAWNQITSEEFDTQVRINLKSAMELIQIYEPSMEKKHWGRIVTVGSVQQYKPHKDMMIYAATKAAQMNMVQNLAKQLAPLGITVNNMAPGVIDTPRNADALADPVYHQKVMEGIPVGFAGTPADCAAPVLLLCSEEGRYINGIDLVVDGGMHL